ncbi:MAG TPA: hydroxymethylbilane synthase [Candidatus Thermoplasmatota archaeon]|nr:hydroxymethylbilane synthase [Candidatus Thermoplasmatota archaeon]
MNLTLASRGSELARLQAREAMVALARSTPGLSIAFHTVKTTGDDYRGALAAAPVRGVFTKEVDEVVLAGGADAAVHSLKDLPNEMHPDLVLAAVLERHFPGDVLFAPAALSKLAPGTVVGTSSPRRRAQVLRSRPDLALAELRGNVPTRIEKQRKGEVGAALVAKAAVVRLGLRSGFFEMNPVDFPHAPGQGAVAIVARKGSEAAKVIARADHKKTRAEIEAERAVLAAVGGGCAAPLGVFARRAGTQIEVVAQLLAPDGSKEATVRRMVPAERPAAGAKVLGEELLRLGAGLA